MLGVGGVRGLDRGFGSRRTGGESSAGRGERVVRRQRGVVMRNLCLMAAVRRRPTASCRRVSATSVRLKLPAAPAPSSTPTP